MYISHKSPASQGFSLQQQGSGALLPYGETLLLLALQDTLRELLAQAFIREDAAEAIAATAQQELVAHLVGLSPSLPSICLNGELMLYRYRQQRWLLVLQRLEGAVIPPLPPSHQPLPRALVGKSISESKDMRLRADMVLAYLRRKRMLDRDSTDGSWRTTTSSRVHMKYNLQKRALPHPQEHLRSAVESHRGDVCPVVGTLELVRTVRAGSIPAGDAGSVAVAGSGAADFAVAESKSSTESKEIVLSPPAISGVTYFSHEKPARASLPFLHATLITTLISSALAASATGDMHHSRLSGAGRAEGKMAKRRRNANE